VHKYYTQLHFSQAEKHFKKVADIVLMHTIINLDNELHVRVSVDAKSVIKGWVDWFIQFPTFTYIRVCGFKGEILMLPRYPSDKIIFIEFLRQAHEVHALLCVRHKFALKFPFTMGIYTCKLATDAKLMNNKLLKLNLKYLNQ
jgi:hypothetical protein